MYCRALTAFVLAMVVGHDAVVAAQPSTDPLETINRAVFRANLTAYDQVLAPVVRYYRVATTEAQRDSVANFLANLRAPVVVANQFMQGQVEQAGITLRRLVINSTVGMLGLFDPATQWGYPAQAAEDFGQTLASYGVPAGPYLVLPLLGPSNARDAIGRIADYLALGTYVDIDVLPAVLGTVAVADAEPDLERIATERATHLDLYAVARSVYEQRRDAAIHNGGPGAGNTYNDIFAE
jgi:phospholipid-binding lipoprotein MlaA